MKAEKQVYGLAERAVELWAKEAAPDAETRLKLDAEDAELWLRKGVVHRHRGESAGAEQRLRWILGLKRPNQFCSFDQEIYGHVT
jgi:Flp pilus assembly protein TadD